MTDLRSCIIYFLLLYLSVDKLFLLLLTLVILEINDKLIRHCPRDVPRKGKAQVNCVQNILSNN